VAVRRIRKLLIANRGEIARRVIRTARRMGIATVVGYADSDARAPFVRDADEAVALRGETALETYLDSGKLIEAARLTGADAVHPGYGFLSENAAFAAAVIEAGLNWVGPPPRAIAAMGDKLAAKKLVADAGVPALESVDVAGLQPAKLARAAARLGYPVLVKAAAGGGGKGMRIVEAEAELATSVAAAERESAAAFGDGRVFLERYLRAPRHVEIQILGDRHGNLVSCFERECSIQRRHQKIIEESPSPALDPALREAMGLVALTVARAIGYSSAGTVEFLLDGDRSFFFLEVNTRLQVEHPVTEAVTGLDLVREQLRIAQDEPLGFEQGDLSLTGHAIEARVYAEDPERDFLPQSGRLVAWEEPSDPPARFESGVEAGSEVSSHFDPMLAKVIVHAGTREEAALRLARVLERHRAHGIKTNIDFLVATLRHEAFLAGDTTTDFIARHVPARSSALDPADLRRAAVAAALAAQARRRERATVLEDVPSGWRNNPSAPQRLGFRARGEDLEIGYLRRRDGAFDYEAGEARGSARVHAFTGDAIDLEVDRVRRCYRLARAGDDHWLHDGLREVHLRELPRFPRPEREQVRGGYLAPMPGRVVEIRVAPGDAVTAGQVLLVLEAMKMEHRILCAADGVVRELRVEVGLQVGADDVLLVIE